MAKRISLKLHRSGVTAIAELQEKYAPRTCEYIWEALPITARVCHAGVPARRFIFDSAFAG
ncbi:MAG: DUF3830 family protein [Anaerolineae bacterium]